MTNSLAFTKDQTHRILWRPGAHVLASSEGLGWSSVFASAQHEAPFEQQVSAVPDHLLVLHVGGPVRVSRKGAEGRHERLIPPGGLLLHPGGQDFDIRLEGSLDTVHLYLRNDFLESVAHELQPSLAAFELLPQIGVIDGLLEQLVLAFRRALSDGVGSSLYAQHLGYATAAHLVRAFSSATERSEPGAPGLTVRQLSRAMACIHASLHDHVGSDDVAAAAGLSTLHFLRRFKLSTGLPLHRYVLRARVDLAKRLLTDTGKSISEIAFACGFAHQEHLTRVFRAWSGTTPAAFRRTAAL